MRIHRAGPGNHYRRLRNDHRGGLHDHGQRGDHNRRCNHGNKEKERGIFFQEYDYERSTNDGDTNIVDLSMPGDTEYGQWVLCRDLSVWILCS